jgi:hypothetical protein
MMSQWTSRFIKSMSLATIHNKYLKFYTGKLSLQKETRSIITGKFMIVIKKKLPT